jgi:hypothetical protein
MPWFRRGRVFSVDSVDSVDTIPDHQTAARRRYDAPVCFENSRVQRKSLAFDYIIV